ncbi:hypothetical protein [Oceaniradius stylonematis]|uniref:hypothetical protein n=1 Tax=Oceaniradius stylonematis TaxID=2184161 RepID=UPI003B591ADA
MRFEIHGRDRTQQAFDSATRRAKSFNGQLDRTGKSFGAAAASARVFGAALAGLTLGRVAREMRDVVSEASQMAKIADKVGVTTDELQRMQFGFGQAGVAVSDLERNLEQWSKRVSEAAAYGGRLADIFEANGLALRDQNGNMRSSVDLLRDYANLVQNAGSAQEQMTLATEAFGRSGGDMILALRNGAAGMDELMGRADDAGGVIEERLLRRAEQLDDAFGRMARRLQTEVKTAFLELADVAMTSLEDIKASADPGPIVRFFETLRQQERAYLQSRAGAAVGQFAVDGIVLPPEPKSERLEQAVDPLAQIRIQSRINQSFGARTVIPQTDRSGSGSAKAAREERDAYADVVKALREELELIGLSETEQRAMREIRRASVETTGEQAAAIRSLVGQIEIEEARMEALRERTEAFNQSVDDIGRMGFDAFEAWATGAATAEEAIRGLAVQLAKAAAEAALLGTGPLSGLLGGGRASGGGGGIFGALAGMFFGRAGGGPVDPHGAYVVGEHGPELLMMGSRSGRVVAPSGSSNTGLPDEIRIVGELVERDGQIVGKINQVIATEASRTEARAVGAVKRSLPSWSQQLRRDGALA